MIYIIDISSNGIETEKISDDLYQNNDFTLTVKAVNDAPVLLQSFEYLSILGDSGAASAVHSTILCDIFPLIYSNDFTLTVKAVNDAPVLLQPFEYLSILGDSGAASVVHRSM